MAFRITEHVLRGEIDNTERGRILARLWLDGFPEPVVLDLMGDCAPDLAGCRLTFVNPASEPAPAKLRSLNSRQTGWVNEFTAARKFRIPTVPMSEYRGRPGQWRLENCLCLEWFSRENFVVNIQGPMRIEIGEPAWRLTAEEYAESREAVYASNLAWMEELHGGPFLHEYVVEDGSDPAEDWQRDDSLPSSSSYQKFAARMDAEMNAPLRPGREILHRLGFEPPRPSELSDEELPGRLWELLYALAGHRIFFYSVDHLSDRDLFEKLDAWLDDEVEDLPWPTDTNINVDLCKTSTGDPAGQEVWLRYYASDEDRKEHLAEGWGESLPPKETPAFSHRRLPSAWFDALDADWEGGELESDASDPLGLAKVDAELELERRRTELAERGGHCGKFAEISPELELAFLRNVERVEAMAWKVPGEVLKANGFTVLAPEHLTDDHLLTARLWELLHQLAQLGLYVVRTNHLTDRGLYVDLWERCLREEAILPGRDSGSESVYDPLGGGSDADEMIHLRYHASDSERERFAQEHPEAALPERADPVVSRDWRLPKPSIP